VWIVNQAALLIGGAGRNRTADKGFADPCLTTWLPRLWHKLRAEDLIHLRIQGSRGPALTENITRKKGPNGSSGRSGLTVL
jgi:hypothetical protein